MSSRWFPQVYIARKRRQFVSRAQVMVARQAEWRNFAEQIESEYRSLTQQMVWHKPKTMRRVVTDVASPSTGVRISLKKSSSVWQQMWTKKFLPQNKQGKGRKRQQRSSEFGICSPSILRTTLPTEVRIRHSNASLLVVSLTIVHARNVEQCCARQVKHVLLEPN